MNMEDKMSIIPSTWASIYNWLTPTVLFLVLNLTIGVIVLTSNLPPKKNSDHRKNHAKFVGNSPILIHTPKSADPNPPTTSESTFVDVCPSETTTIFYLHHQNEKFPRETETQFMKTEQNPGTETRFSETQGHYPETETQFVETEQNLEEIHTSLAETEQTGDANGGKEEREAPEKEWTKTHDEIFNQLEKESEFAGKYAARKPPAAKPRKSGVVKSGLVRLEENDGVEDEDDEEVDAKADDFINKFKEQLKLQRIESWRKSNAWAIDGL